ncbi:DUF4012 domain-containing protein [Bifidobacterium felsineum]|uniref:Chemotaxis protein n=1 Tax=Bifidobacterium felsineum TaxID=2045440 RepID=A0A2M9HID2_9BIFI|nr:DUF4012 domain-containing protein [Bifidobacterium felsineum]MBT1164843.1 DUF4012 domain-containing protein [Bifidobacterium felsineum]PJM76576.1 hypothetical protein CSQ86_08815 [Bifidobacterium felsineum]
MRPNSGRHGRRDSSSSVTDGQLSGVPDKASQGAQHVNRKGRLLLTVKPVWARVLIVLLLVLFASVTCVTTLYAASAARLVNGARLVMTSTQNLANAALGCGSDESLSDAAKNLVKGTNDLNEELSSPHWDFIQDHTRYGSDITAAREMLASVDTLVNGPFTDLTNLANQLQGLSMKDNTVDVSALMGMPKIIKSTHKSLKAQIAKLDKIPQPSIDKVALALNAEKSALNTLDSMLSEYDALIQLMPRLLGKNEKRTYLVLVQNPAELRSAGGMVGTIAAVTAYKGKVTIGDFESTYGWDTPDAMDDTVLEERDVFGATFDQYPATTTIDPEFQRVALMNKYLWSYQKGNGGKNVAGVIGLDPVFLQSLLGATGEVKLSDGKVMNGSTVVPFLLHDLYVEHPNFVDQNNYVSEAAHEIMTHVLDNANGSNAGSLLKAVRETSANGNFKLWMKDKAEQEALISTGLIDDKSSGELSADETVPQSGIYLSELQQGKQDWYLKTATTVTKTCGDTSAATKATLTGSLDDRIKSAVTGTRIGLLSSDEMGDEYTVTFTMKNTMTKEEAKSLPSFVTGEGDAEVPGGQLYRIVLTAPYGGEITAVQADATLWNTRSKVLYDRQYISFDQDWIEPGEEKTIAFTVRVKNTATQPLNVITTPIVNKDGIEIGSNGKVTDECPAQSTSTGDDSANADANAGQDQSNSAGQSGTSQQDSTENSNTNKDLTGSLDSLDQIRGQLSCPVDIKSIASIA